MAVTSHTLVEKLKVINKKEPTIVAQVKDYGQFLGKVDVAFDKKVSSNQKNPLLTLIPLMTLSKKMRRQKRFLMGTNRYSRFKRREKDPDIQMSF
ncbi:hypothetical protein ACEQPO_05960 [Bacillus sp. SL00103]